jgi:hypothetical protein
VSTTTATPWWRPCAPWKLSQSNVLSSLFLESSAGEHCDSLLRLSCCLGLKAWSNSPGGALQPSTLLPACSAVPRAVLPLPSAPRVGLLHGNDVTTQSWVWAGGCGPKHRTS